MSTKTESAEVCVPYLTKFRYTSLSAERSEVPEEAKLPGNGKITAITDLSLADVTDGLFKVVSKVAVTGKRGDVLDFEVQIAAEALFQVPESADREDCETEESLRHVTAQLGPMLVMKARALMTDLGINGLALSFFDPTQGFVRHEDGGGSSD